MWRPRRTEGRLWGVGYRSMALMIGLALVALGPTTWAEPTPALQEHYKTAKASYEQAKRQGLPLAHLNGLVAEIEEARRQKRWETLPSLLERLQAELRKVAADADQEPALATSPQPMPATASRAKEDAERKVVRTELDLLKALFAHPSFLKLVRARSAQVDVNEQGAVGRNRRTFSDVAAQRDVIWILLRGLADQDPKALEDCVRAMEYGFQHQTSQGNFKNGLGYGAVEAMTADAFFLQAFGHVYLLLEQDRHGAELLPRLRRLEPQLRKALAWLKDNRQELLRQDRNAPNRLAFDALAFLLNGRILGDLELQRVGFEFIQANLAKQRQDGVFLEHGGHDTSYQAVNALVLQSLWFYLEDAALKAAVYDAVRKGLAWQRTRIQASGQIQVKGNTRTGLGQEKLFGKTKDVNYPEVALALFYWSRLEGAREFEDLAAAVTAHALGARR